MQLIAKLLVQIKMIMSTTPADITKSNNWYKKKDYNCFGSQYHKKHQSKMMSYYCRRIKRRYSYKHISKQ